VRTRRRPAVNAAPRRSRGRRAPNPGHGPEARNYADTLARRTAVIRRCVEVTVRSLRRKPPILLDLEGVLQQTDQVEDAETIGWDPQALRLGLGSGRITLHPDQFVDATFTPTTRGGWLKLVMGKVELDFHY
jgi:hypothetical protein